MFSCYKIQLSSERNLYFYLTKKIYKLNVILLKAVESRRHNCYKSCTSPHSNKKKQLYTYYSRYNRTSKTCYLLMGHYTKTLQHQLCRCTKPKEKKYIHFYTSILVPYNSQTSVRMSFMVKSLFYCVLIKEHSA